VRSCVFFSLFFSLILVVPSQAAKTAEDHWMDVGLSLNSLALDNTSCNQNDRWFAACFQAINAALSFEKPATLLVPVSRTKQEKGFGAIAKDFGAVVTVEPKAFESDDFAEIYANIRSERKLNTDALTELYKNRATEPVDFIEILDWVKTGTVFKAKESYVVGAMLNAHVGITKDPHTYFLPRALFDESNTAGSSDFVGIGAVLKNVKKNNKSKIVVQQPLEGGPGFKAGIRASDVITHVDGVETENLELEAVVDKIRGPKGTVVKLTIQRGPDVIELSITRDLIEMKNVTQKMVGATSNIAYIKLADFMKRDKAGNTLVYSESLKALKALLANKPQGVIFDLRDNGGGLLTESVRIASLFLKKGSLVVSTKDFKGNTTNALKTADAQVTDLPMVVLTNARSASASEIVAGALQDHQRAFIVGERTFGKGTVQTVRPFLGNLKLVSAYTIEYFLLPSGRSNQIETVQPDVEIFVNPSPTAADKAAFREEDEYAVLPTPLGKKWVQPRPNEVKQLQDCIAKGKAGSTFAAAANAAIPPDYQLLVGADAVQCIIDEKIWTRDTPAPTWSAPGTSSPLIESIKSIFFGPDANEE
jgi:C-terminal peptidase prc